MTEHDELYPQTELDRLVDEYLLLRNHIDKLSDELEYLKDRLRDLGPGQYDTSDGISVLITEPPRSFDLDKAMAILPGPIIELSKSIDPAKIKTYLAPHALDQCMRPGKGKRQVKIK